MAETGQLDNGIFYRHWRSSVTTRAVVLLAHGLGEHSGRYQALAEFLGRRGYAVVAPDHVGHGESAGRRAHLRGFDEFLGPLLELREKIASWYPQLPCFLLGHSLGGLIATRLLLDHQDKFSGAALSGAALQAAEPPSAVLTWIAKLLSFCWPSLGLLQLDPAQVSRDPEVVQRYIDDPLVHKGKASARLVTELFEAMERVKSDQQSLSLPLLIMHGGKDVMTASEGSRAFHQGIGSADRTLKIYPPLYHEIFNEPEQLEVMADLADWLDARV